MTVTLHAAPSEAHLILTPAALNHILSSLKESQSKRGVRFSVKKTGCSGLSYVVTYIDALGADDLLQKIDDHYLICVDKSSYPFLKGVEIDYVKEGFSSKFVFNNPNQKGVCGCGESFTV